MFFSNQPTDYEPLPPEELNALIEQWGEEIFKEERERRLAEAFLSDDGHPGPTPEGTRHRFAFIRAWKNFNRRPRIIDAIKLLGQC